MASAINGNGSAQRAFLEMIRLFEAAAAAQAAANQPAAGGALDATKITDIEVVRRIAFILEKAKRILDERRAAGLADSAAV